MTIIKLTSGANDNHEIYVNIDKIETFGPFNPEMNGDYYKSRYANAKSYVNIDGFEDNALYVKETPDEIAKRIRVAQREQHILFADITCPKR